MREYSWIAQAACRGLDRENRDRLFFPEKGYSSEAGKKICLGIAGFKYRPGRPPCPVKDECLAYAMSFGEGEIKGVWGGTSENDRRLLYSKLEVRNRRISA